MSSTTSYPPPAEPMMPLVMPGQQYPPYPQVGMGMPPNNYGINPWVQPGVSPRLPPNHVVLRGPGGRFAPQTATNLPGSPPLSPAYSLPGMPQPMMQPSNNSSMFTRNLIGSTTVSAQNLYDLQEKAGIWFVLQDLSVRQEGRFRYVDIAVARNKMPALSRTAKPPFFLQRSAPERL